MICCVTFYGQERKCLTLKSEKILIIQIFLPKVLWQHAQIFIQEPSVSFSFFDLKKSLSPSHVTKYLNSRTSRSNTGTVRLGDATSSKPKIKYDAFVNKDDLNAILTCIRRFQTMLDAWNELDESPDAELLFHRGLERSHGKDTDEYWLEYVVFKFITSVTYFHHRKIARTATLKCTLQHSRIPTLEHQRSNTGTSDNFRV